jgi:microcystin-dependent protein
MKWLKKVAATPLTSIARVVDSLSAATNDRTNAPSIHAVREAVNNNWLSIYPIGSIYMSVNNVNPSTIFGGTWQQIKDKFLLACGDTYNNGATGGSATHTLAVNQLPSHSHHYTRATGVGSHMLTLNEIPNHSHKYAAPEDVYSGFKEGTGATINPAIGVQELTTTAVGGGQAHNHPLNTDTPNTESVGSGAAINHMPPYLAVNVWVRTA